MSVGGSWGGASTAAGVGKDVEGLAAQAVTAGLALSPRRLRAVEDTARSQLQVRCRSSLVGRLVNEPDGAVWCAATASAGCSVRDDHVGWVAAVDLRRHHVEGAGAVTLDVVANGRVRRFAAEDDRLVGGLEVRAASARQLRRLRHPGPVQPHQRVAQLEPRVLHARRQAVNGSRCAEREKVTAGLEYARALGRPSRRPRLERLAA